MMMPSLFIYDLEKKVNTRNTIGANNQSGEITRLTDSIDTRGFHYASQSEGCNLISITI